MCRACSASIYKNLTAPSGSFRNGRRPFSESNRLRRQRLQGRPVHPGKHRLFDVETRFVCKACSKRGADVRPDFNWGKVPVAMTGYR
jgi:hypothetical protein